MNRNLITIVVLYILLLAGGLWHVLGVLQTAMRLLAAPMMAALCLLLCFESLRRVPATTADSSQQPSPEKFILWSLLVCISGFLIELAGVNTGVIFGGYIYGDTLQPTLWNVPIAIGFAWLGMIISSAAISQRLLSPRFSRRPLLMAAMIGSLMVVFDWFMEPAAMKLAYWNWRNGIVPLRNYLTWFVCGFVLSYIGLRLRLLFERSSMVAVHAYIAQLGYFVLVNFS